MSEKTLQSLRSSSGRSTKKKAHQTNANTARLMQQLSDIPAFQATNALSEMLYDLTDPETRTAILDARVQILRARARANKAGTEVNSDTTLSELFGDKFPKG